MKHYHDVLSFIVFFWITFIFILILLFYILVHLYIHIHILFLLMLLYIMICHDMWLCIIIYYHISLSNTVIHVMYTFIYFPVLRVSYISSYYCIILCILRHCIFCTTIHYYHIFSSSASILYIIILLHNLMFYTCILHYHLLLTYHILLHKNLF